MAAGDAPCPMAASAAGAGEEALQDAAARAPVTAAAVPATARVIADPPPEPFRGPPVQLEPLLQLLQRRGGRGDVEVATVDPEALASASPPPTAEGRGRLRRALLEAFNQTATSALSSVAMGDERRAAPGFRCVRRRLSGKTPPPSDQFAPPGLRDQSASSTGPTSGPAAPRPPDGGPEADLGWVLLALAAALPLLGQALPRDQHGVCVMPHPHPMVERRAPRGRRYADELGRPAYDTGRACDNCDAPIVGRVYFACASGCEVDFCKRCHDRLQQLFEGLDAEHATWAGNFVSRAASYVLTLMGPAQRRQLAWELAFSWPTAMFERLVKAVVDVADAKVVHLQDNSAHIKADVDFWSTVGFLQLLYAANHMPAGECRFGELAPRGPRVPRDAFVLAGIDKCDAEGEWSRWTGLNTERSEALRRSSIWEQVLAERRVDVVTDEFASFLTHSNLLPTTFWQRCLQQDIACALTALAAREREERLQRERLEGRRGGRTHCRRLHIEVSREIDALVGGVTQACGNAELLWLLSRPFTVSFAGEPASGPGVTREFLSLSVQGILGHARSGCPQCGSRGPGDDLLWECDPELRVYWFRNPGDSGASRSFRALGVLLGHTLLNRSLLPAAFPPVFFELLLGALGSERARPAFSLGDLAGVSPAMARSFDRLLEYDGEDIAEFFTLDWPRSAELCRENRAEHVNAYLQWYFTERYKPQLGPLLEGFRAVVGSSKLLGSLVDAVQLEQMLCGAEAPVDVAAIRSGAVEQDWTPGDRAYLEAFWEVLAGLSDAEKRSFVTFVSACGRTPPRGWQDLGLTVQRNGRGDERLPTAFTCFTLLLLPRYSSPEILASRLRAAIVDTEGFGLS